MLGKISKNKNSYQVSVKENGEFVKYYLSNCSLRGSVGTSVTVSENVEWLQVNTPYQIQGYRKGFYSLSTFEDKTKTVDVPKDLVIHKLKLPVLNGFYHGFLRMKKTKQGSQAYFVITSEILPSKKKNEDEDRLNLILSE